MHDPVNNLLECFTRELIWMYSLEERRVTPYFSLKAKPSTEGWDVRASYGVFLNKENDRLPEQIGSYHEEFVETNLFGVYSKRIPLERPPIIEIHAGLYDTSEQFHIDMPFNMALHMHGGIGFKTREQIYSQQYGQTTIHWDEQVLKTSHGDIIPINDLVIPDLEELISISERIMEESNFPGNFEVYHQSTDKNWRIIVELYTSLLCTKEHEYFPERVWEYIECLMGDMHSKLIEPVAHKKKRFELDPYRPQNDTVFSDYNIHSQYNYYDP